MIRKQQLEFIESIAPAAQASHKAHGVPASVIMAQAILESAWGQSALTRVAHNYFGIKNSPRWKDGYAQFLTTEFVGGKKKVEKADFEFFPTPAACFDAHGELLSTLERYRPAMNDADDPLVFAARLQDCGYATDPQYAKKVVKLITDFKLTRFDSLTRGTEGRGGVRRVPKSRGERDAALAPATAFDQQQDEE